MAIKVGDKVRIIDEGTAGLPIGTVATVTEVDYDGDVYLDVNNQYGQKAFYLRRRVEKVSGKPTKKQRISDLEREVASLRRNLTDAAKQIEALVERVTALEGASVDVKFVPVTTDNIAVGDKIRVIDADGIAGGFDLSNGKIYEVKNVECDGDFYFMDDEGDRLMIVSGEFAYIEKVVSE